MNNMKDLFSYTKLFTILFTIFYIFGLLGSFFEHEILFSSISFLILLCLVLFLNLDFKKIIVLYLIFFIGLIKANQSLKLPSILDEVYSNDAIIKGQIISSNNISNKNDKIKFFLKTNEVKVNNETFKDLNIKFLISINKIEKYKNEISIGDYAELKGKLRHPNYASNPHQFDYRNYLLNKDVKNILYADDFKKLKEPDFKTDKWYFVLKKLEKARNNIIEKHSKNIKSPRLEILGGIIFGSETINPDEEIKENFKNSGLLHLLAASGLNVALIYGIWWWIATFIRFPYNLSILIGAIFVILYTFMTGFPPSILRASIMLLFVLFGKIIDRNTNSLALIFFVGFLMLFTTPKILFDVSFQLSFIVTIGLVICIPIITAKFDKIDKKYKEKYKNFSRIKKYFITLFLPSSLVTIVAIPLVAQLCVMPLQMHYFNNFTPFSLLANIAVVPFIGFLSFIGFVSSFFALIPVIGQKIIYVFDLFANPLLGLLVKISEFFASSKYSLITTIGLNAFQIGIFWIIGLLSILNLKNNFKNKKQIIFLTVCIILFFISFFQFKNNNLEIIMFDVENADSFLIKTPKNKYIMIDTGKKSYNGSTSAQLIINKFLKNERINKIEYLIITHFDSDHCGGVIDILKENKVNKIIIQSETPKSQTSKEILNYLKENKLNYSIAKNNDEIYFEDDVKIKTFTPNLKNDNESSIITLLTYKNKNALFMGDSNTKGYKNISNYLPNEVEIIKIGHHGSKNSINNDMIKNLKPKYALISVGYNKFNHPNSSIINILEENNINIISTRTFGFSKIILKNKEIRTYHYDNSKKRLKEISFKDFDSIPFHESEFLKNFISKNSK
ncbi:MAG: DNA internalization-related competence protein ComEC/Rec2 [Candidatus Gastranaerophilales bacterium]|nr:DNA internalization-related competence protein ComEC/Rec2 [Candidatus Gastranaerophilales bacterium]